MRHPIETACVSYTSRRAACRWKACRLFSRHSASTCSSSIYATININTVVLRGTLSNVSRTRVLCACAVVCISHGGTLYKETPRSTLQHNISRRRGILAPVLFCVARHSAVARCVYASLHGARTLFHVYIIPLTCVACSRLRLLMYYVQYRFRRTLKPYDNVDLHATCTAVDVDITPK